MLLVYVCLIAGVQTFQDRPCVERPPGPPLVGTINEVPRYGVDRGGPPGSRPATEGSTVYHRWPSHQRSRR
jgi:hypothetical protein